MKNSSYHHSCTNLKPNSAEGYSYVSVSVGLVVSVVVVVVAVVATARAPWPGPQRGSASSFIPFLPVSSSTTTRRRRPSVAAARRRRRPKSLEQHALSLGVRTRAFIHRQRATLRAYMRACVRTFVPFTARKSARAVHSRLLSLL